MSPAPVLPLAPDAAARAPRTGRGSIPPRLAYLSRTGRRWVATPNSVPQLTGLVAELQHPVHSVECVSTARSALQCLLARCTALESVRSPLALPSWVRFGTICLPPQQAGPDHATWAASLARSTS